MAVDRRVQDLLSELVSVRTAVREAEQAHLRKGGGGGTSDGMEPSLQRLDDKIDSNFKWLLGVFGAGFMILLGAFAAGFLTLMTKLDASFDRVEGKLDKASDAASVVAERTARLEGAAQASDKVQAQP